MTFGLSQLYISIFEKKYEKPMTFGVLFYFILFIKAYILLLYLCNESTYIYRDDDILGLKTKINYLKKETPQR
jgi:hypothetical protein